jgi:hypothetical protein
MAYFADLSNYAYSGDRPKGPAVMLNVGWLAAEQPFPTGACPADFIARLRELAQKPVALMRGFHWCEFCPRPIDWERTPRGSGEIRVSGVRGVTYAAPALVLHYVEAHGYRPPEEFIAAVLNAA